MAMQHYQNRQPVPLLQEVFERIYVLRQQIFHGAATDGSHVNRHTLGMGTRVSSESQMIYQTVT